MLESWRIASRPSLRSISIKASGVVAGGMNMRAANTPTPGGTVRAAHGSMTVLTLGTTMPSRARLPSPFSPRRVIAYPRATHETFLQPSEMAWKPRLPIWEAGAGEHDVPTHHFGFRSCRWSLHVVGGSSGGLPTGDVPGGVGRHHDGPSAVLGGTPG